MKEMSLFKNIYSNLLLEISKQDIYSKFYSDVLSQEDFDYITAFNPKKLLPVCKMILDSIKNGEITVAFATDLIAEINALPQEKDSRGLVPIQVANEMVKNGEISEVFELKAVIKNGLKSPISKMQMAKDGLVVLYDENGYRLTCTLTYSASNHYFGASHWCTASDREGRWDGYEMFCQYTRMDMGRESAFSSRKNVLLQLKTPEGTYQLQVGANGNIGQVCDYDDNTIEPNEIQNILDKSNLSSIVNDGSKMEMLVTKMLELHKQEIIYQGPKTQYIRDMRWKIDCIVDDLQDFATDLNDEWWDNMRKNFGDPNFDDNQTCLRHDKEEINYKGKIYEAHYFAFENMSRKVHQYINDIIINVNGFGKKLNIFTNLRNNKEILLEKAANLELNDDNCIAISKLINTKTGEIINKRFFDGEYTKYVLFGDLILVSTKESFILPEFIYYVPEDRLIGNGEYEVRYAKRLCEILEDGKYAFGNRHNFFLLDTSKDNPIVCDTVNTNDWTQHVEDSFVHNDTLIQIIENGYLMIYVKPLNGQGKLYEFEDTAAGNTYRYALDGNDTEHTYIRVRKKGFVNVLQISDTGQCSYVFSLNDKNISQILLRTAKSKVFLIAKHNDSFYHVAFSPETLKYYLAKITDDGFGCEIGEEIDPEYMVRQDNILSKNMANWKGHNNYVQADIDNAYIKQFAGSEEDYENRWKQAENDIQNQKRQNAGPNPRWNPVMNNYEDWDDNDESIPHMNEVKKKIDSLNKRIELL